MKNEKKEPDPIKKYHLKQTESNLNGMTNAQIVSYNQWAAVALDLYHKDYNVQFEMSLDSVKSQIVLEWDSNFDKSSMAARREIAENGAVSMALFVMSVLLDFHHVFQSEIGEGVDYGFHKQKPDTDNFLKDCHFTEISGILEEKGTNTLLNRIKDKHDQIKKGTRSDNLSSVVATLFIKPITVKEIHK